MVQSKMTSRSEYGLDTSDAKYKTKNISTWIIELIYGTERGGRIFIWQKGKSDLHHIWTPSDNDKYLLADEVGFMEYENAIAEYNKLKSVKDIVDLMWRNR